MMRIFKQSNSDSYKQSYSDNYKRSYSDSYKRSYSDLFRVSIDPRVKPEGDRKESVPEDDEIRKNVPEGDRKESVPEGDEIRKNVPEGGDITNMYRDDNFKKSSLRAGTRGQAIFELEKNKIGRALEFFALQKIEMTSLKDWLGGMTVKNKCNREMSVLMMCILVSSTSIAKAECTPTPDCASIGYTETSCDGKFVRCPFDTSKLFCVPCDSAYQFICNGEGYSGGVGKSCNNKYISCECSENYEWDGSACVKNCQVGYSTAVTSCGSGYTLATGGYSGNKACGICFSNSTGCPDGYSTFTKVRTNNGADYTNNSDLYIVNASKNDYCVPSATIYRNNSMSQFSFNSDGHIVSTGTYTVSNFPYIITRISGELIINGDVSIGNNYLMNSSAKLIINGKVTIIAPTMFLSRGAKFCPKEIDLSSPLLIYDENVRTYWCIKDWSGWGDSVGSGPCDFDGECYY